MRRITGYGGGGDDSSSSSSRAPVEAPDSLHSRSYAKVLDLLSEGPIYGFPTANGLQSIYLNETPIVNQDGSPNFALKSFQNTLGTQTQDPIAGFPSVEDETSVGVEFTSAVPWVVGITDTSLSAVRVRLAVNQLTTSDVNTGDLNGGFVKYFIELSTSGGAFVPQVETAFNGKTTTRYERTHRIELPASTTGWTIRVRRETPNATTTNVQDKTYVASYTEVIDAKLRYPMSAVAGIQLDASQFSSIPSRAFDLMGRIIKVPDNYDPIARTYSGVWAGTFQLAYSNNPAWVFYDLVLNDRYGLGARVSASQIDRYALYNIAKYCDEYVPDGMGGVEPRFTCNVYIQTQADAYKILQDLASIFRGMAYWGGGQIVATADIPQDPSFVYNQTNVIGGKFQYTGSPQKTRYTTALVSWNDPSDFYRTKIEAVQDQDGIARYGVQQVELTAYGCTSRGQAQRVGLWACATSRLETQVVTFSVGLDGVLCTPGQIIRISDPNRLGRRNGGRIHSVTGTAVTVDKVAVINVGDAFTVVLPNGVSETRIVSSVVANTVDVSVPWSIQPNAESVWSVDNTDLTAPTYKVLTVSEKDGLIFDITASQHEPGKFAYIDNGTKIVPTPQSVVPLKFQTPPTGVVVSTYDTIINGGTSTTMRIVWNKPVGAVLYGVQWQRSNGEWVSLGTTASTSIEVAGIYAGAYAVRVWAINSIGAISSVVTATATLSGNTGLPPDVPWFYIDDDKLTWGEVVDAELAGYEIRYHYGINRSWGDAIDLVAGIITENPYQLVSKPQGQLTIMIKAVNKVGAESSNAAVIITQLGDVLVDNVVETFDFQAQGYPGIITGGTIVGNQIRANGSSTFYKIDDSDFWSVDDSSMFYIDMYSTLVYETSQIIPVTTAVGLQMVLNVDFQGASRLIEYKIVGTEPMFPVSDSYPFYSTDDSSAFYTDNSVWQTWPGSIAADNVAYKFRFTVDPGSIQGVIGPNCYATIDVPDITESFNNITISSSGTRLPITKSYLSIENIQLTLEASGTAFTVKYYDKNNTLGPLIKCTDQSGALVSGIVDATIQGY